MADDFRNDPDYNQTKKGIIGSGIKTFVWAGIAALTAGTAVGIGLTFSGVFLGAAAIFSAYNAWSAQKDGEMAQAEVTAQRTAYHIKKTMQEERAASIARMQDGQGASDTNWKATIEAQRGASQNAR